jgi:hypothetical protein
MTKIMRGVAREAAVLQPLRIAFPTVCRPAPANIAAHVGHSRKSLTLDTYAHVLIEEERAA